MKRLFLLVTLVYSSIAFGGGNDLSNMDTGPAQPLGGTYGQSSSQGFNYVSNTGNLDYSIAIPNHSGIGGRAPVPMTLSYTGGGAGMVGGLWSLGGLSKIWLRGPSDSAPTGDSSKDQLYISYPGGSGKMFKTYNGNG